MSGEQLVRYSKWTTDRNSRPYPVVSPPRYLFLNIFKSPRTTLVMQSRGLNRKNIIWFNVLFQNLADIFVECRLCSFDACLAVSRTSSEILSLWQLSPRDGSRIMCVVIPLCIGVLTLSWDLALGDHTDDSLTINTGSERLLIQPTAYRIYLCVSRRYSPRIY